MLVCGLYANVMPLWHNLLRVTRSVVYLACLVFFDLALV